MGLCVSSKDDDESTSDKITRDQHAKDDRINKDDKITREVQLTAEEQKESQRVNDDPSSTKRQTTEDHQVAEDMKIVNEDDVHISTENNIGSDEKEAKNEKIIGAYEKTQGSKVLWSEHQNEEQYIAELCKRYSSDNPITEEESELFLKELTFPIPSKPHITLSEDDVAGKRVFVIGDVHGCYDNLISLLHIADLDKEPNAVVIFVGDILNKGPKSCEVLKFVRSSNFHCVMGNHERSAVRKLRLMKMDVGYEPKASKQWLHDLDESDYEYLKELPYTISIPSLNAIIIHGGLLPGKSLEDHTPDEMLLMRNIIIDGKHLKATKHITQGQLWGELWKGPQHVYFGHHALEGLQRYPYATGLDTGCVYHGSLTGVFLTGDKQLVSVKNEGCRNQEEDRA